MKIIHRRAAADLPLPPGQLLRRDEEGRRRADLRRRPHPRPVRRLQVGQRARRRSWAASSCARSEPPSSSLLLASMLVFLGVRALPGDPALALGGEDRDPAVMAADPALLRARPAVAGAVRALARPRRARRPRQRPAQALRSAHTIVTRLPITLELAGLAIVIGLGPRASSRASSRRCGGARRRTTRRRRSRSSACRVPHFWLGLLMIILFAVNLHWLPAGGYVPFARGPAREPAAHADAGDRARHRALGGA